MHFLLKIVHFTSRTPGSSWGTISLLQDLRTPKPGYATACCLGAPTNATLIRFWLFVASCWGLASLERGNPHTLLAVLSVCWKLRMFRHCNSHTLSVPLDIMLEAWNAQKVQPSHTFGSQDSPGAPRSSQESRIVFQEGPGEPQPRRSQESPGASKVYFLI